MAQIINLDRPAFAPRVGCKGFRFPAVYRTEGTYWTQDEDGDGIIAGDTPAEPNYSLNARPAGLANARVTMLQQLDPKIDNGWLIVRRHASENLASSYVECLCDQDWLCDNVRGQTVYNLYRTPMGVFTLQHITKQTERHEDHLMVFVAKDPSWIEERHWIVRSDGSVSEDVDGILAD